jgi:hypothetical protein
MQIFFDIRTLSLFSGFISACIFVCMVYVYKNRKTYSGFNQWTLAYMLNFLGFVFLSLRNILPDFITIILANTFIVLCFAFIARGLVDFAEGKQNIWLDISPIFVVIITFCYFSYSSPNVNARIAVISLVIMFVCLRCISILRLKIETILGMKNWLLMATFIFLALWFLLRVVLTILFENKIHDFMSAGVIHGLSIIAVSIGHIFIAVGLIIINAQRLEHSLVNAKEEIKTLRGILPLCSFCKKIRDDKGYWEQVDVYIHKHSQADISHSICPDCTKEHYPDLDIYDD